MGDAKPDWTENPFGQDASPFGDPSVTAATSEVPAYDPFSGAGAGAPASLPVTQQSDAAPAPAWADTGAAAAAAKADKAATAAAAKADKAAKAAEAKAKKAVDKAEAAAIKRTKEEEKRLAAYEANSNPEARRKKDPNFRPANWPPFTKKITYRPFKWICVSCFHHDVEGEIPDWGLKGIRRLYYTWLVFFILLFFNWISCMTLLFCGNSKSTTDGSTLHDCTDGGTSAGYATLYLFVAAPATYMCWFQPIYQGMRKDSSLRFAWFFLLFSLQLAFACYLGIGLKGKGGMGIITASEAAKSKGHEYIGYFGFCVAACWVLFACWCCAMLMEVMRIYRTSGQSLEKAQKEGARGAVKAGAGL